jgi:hypothetical protein
LGELEQTVSLILQTLAGANLCRSFSRGCARSSRNSLAHDPAHTPVAEQTLLQ